MKGFLALAAVVLTGGFAAPAAADELIGFQSPSGNIHCLLYSDAGGATARCDLRQLKKSYTKRPSGCDQDWGSAFAVDRKGKGYLACVGDTVVDRSNPVLRYGKAMSLGNISCVSAKTGITCTNADGHGFSVAKAGQKLF
ncbi:MAG: DUF6636 domain-containing protein [Paracoccaceae bacterium]